MPEETSFDAQAQRVGLARFTERQRVQHAGTDGSIKLDTVLLIQRSITAAARPPARLELTDKQTV